MIYSCSVEYERIKLTKKFLLQDMHSIKDIKAKLLTISLNRCYDKNSFN